MHGSAFEFLRNTALDARNYFLRPRGYRQNQFGGTLGGAPFTNRSCSLAITRHAPHGRHRHRRHLSSIRSGTDRRLQPESAHGSVSGPYLAGLLSARLGRMVTAGEPYADVFPAALFPKARGLRRRLPCCLMFPTQHRSCAIRHGCRGADAHRQQGRAPCGLDARQRHADRLLLSRSLFSRQSLSTGPAERASRDSTPPRAGSRSSPAWPIQSPSAAQR